MKSFGVRLAAGAVTILLGAFAAVQAQKDRQSASPESWNAATPPSLDQTPEPIAVPASAAWLNDPDVSPTSGQTPESFPGASPVALVQHTEPVEPSGPASESAPTPEDPPQPGFQPDFDSQSPAFNPSPSGFDPGMPGFDPGKPDASDTAEATEAVTPGWSLPAADVADPSAAAESAALMTLPVVAADAQGAAPAADLPEMQFAESPTMSFPTEATGAGGTSPTLAQDAGAAAGADRFPNALRNDPSADNQLRGDESVGAAPQSNFAADAAPSSAINAGNDGFGVPAAFAQPEGYAPSAGLGQPTGIVAGVGAAAGAAAATALGQPTGVNADAPQGFAPQGFAPAEFARSRNSRHRHSRHRHSRHRHSRSTASPKVSPPPVSSHLRCRPPPTSRTRAALPLESPACPDAPIRWASKIHWASKQASLVTRRQT